MTTPSEIVGRRVRHWRTERGLTVAALAARCALAGRPDLNKTILTNIENIRRGDVSVERLFALALALQVEPAQLLMPGDPTPVAITPTHTVTSAGLARWLSEPSPEHTRWTATLHTGTTLAGTAVVLDERHLLTSNSIRDDENLRAAFPTADDLFAAPVPVRVRARQPDFAVLELLGGLPDGVTPAPRDAVPAPFDLPAEPGPTARRLFSHELAAGVYGVAPVRGMIAAVGAAPLILTWNPYTGQQVSGWKGHGSNVNAVCELADGVLASAGDDRVIRLWDGDGPTRELTGHTSEIYCLCPVSGLLASAGNDRTVRIWDPAEERELRRLDGHRSWIRWLCPIDAGPGQILASAGDEPTIRLWDPLTGNVIGALTGHDGGVYGLCSFTLDGRAVLASAGSDQTVQVWDPATGRVIGTLIGHRGTINALTTVTVNGRVHIASAGADHTVRLWDLVTDRAVLEVDAGDQALSLSEISPGILAVGTLSGLQVLDVDPGRGGPG